MYPGKTLRSREITWGIRGAAGAWECSNHLLHTTDQKYSWKNRPRNLYSDNYRISSIQFSRPVMSDSLQLHGLHHPGLPVHHYLLEFTQTHVQWVGDAIQPTHPLLSSSPPAFNPSQHQGLFQWVSSSYQGAKLLEFQLQHQSFQWIFRTDFL